MSCSSLITLTHHSLLITHHSSSPITHQTSLLIPHHSSFIIHDSSPVTPAGYRRGPPLRPPTCRESRCRNRDTCHPRVDTTSRGIRRGRSRLDGSSCNASTPDRRTRRGCCRDR